MRGAQPGFSVEVDSLRSEVVPGTHPQEALRVEGESSPFTSAPVPSRGPWDSPGPMFWLSFFFELFPPHPLFFLFLLFIYLFIFRL